jgi:membrane-associated phospholipid phosphatase
VIGCLFIIYIGFARIELGLHLPSDILFTWIMAAGITYCVANASRAFLHAPPVRKES